MSTNYDKHVQGNPQLSAIIDRLKPEPGSRLDEAIRRWSEIVGRSAEVSSAREKMRQELEALRAALPAMTDPPDVIQAQNRIAALELLLQRATVELTGLRSEKQFAMLDVDAINESLGEADREVRRQKEHKYADTGQIAAAERAALAARRRYLEAAGNESERGGDE
jgi:hypothetical protein